MYLKIITSTILGMTGRLIKIVTAEKIITQYKSIKHVSTFEKRLSRLINLSTRRRRVFPAERVHP